MSCGIGTMSARVDVVAQDSGGARTMAPVLAELEVAWAVPDTKVLVATGSVITERSAETQTSFWWHSTRCVIQSLRIKEQRFGIK